jgi:hypothetical protein
MSNSKHAIAVALSELPTSEWSNIFKTAATLRKERERRNRDLEEAETCLPHKQPSSASEFSSVFYVTVELITHFSQRYVKITSQELPSHTVAP